MGDKPLVIANGTDADAIINRLIDSNKNKLVINTVRADGT
jgi:hypothetical protein